MDKARAMLGWPDLQRMATGKVVTVKLRPGTTEVEIRLSCLAQSELAKPKKSEFSQDFEDLVATLRK